VERVEEKELLDSDQWPAEDVDCALSAIRRVNRLFGGDRMHRQLFYRVASQKARKSIDVLEVASGRGEVVAAVARTLQKKNISMRISLLDRSELHLPRPGNWYNDLLPPVLLVGDALEIPLPDRSVDVVSCCLFFHHLSAAGARAFLQESLRVARIAVLVNDLERTRANYLLSRLNTLIDPSSLSRHDGPTSVRQAYTLVEMHQMLGETGCPFELRRGFLFRLGAILWKSSTADYPVTAATRP